MSITVQTYEQIRDGIIADLMANLTITVNGQPVNPDFSVGSDNLEFSKITAATMDYFYARLQQVDSSLRLKSAVGQDLRDLTALIGAEQGPGLQSKVPIKFSSNSPGTFDLTIPTDYVVLAKDKTGNPTIAFTTQQDPSRDPGIAGVKLAGSRAGWVWGTCTAFGLLGNIAAGQIVLGQGLIVGIDAISNPPVNQPPAPGVTPNTTGLVRRQYCTVALGLTGKTTPSPLGETLLGNVTPNDTLAWTGVPDAQGYEVLLNTGTPAAPVWSLIGTTSAVVTTFTFTTQTPVAYALPLGNTTNMGTGGLDPESDDAYRKRAPKSLAVAAKATKVSVLGQVALVPGVLQVFGVDAGEPDNVGDEVAGLVPGGKFHVKVLGNVNPLDAPTQALISGAVKGTKAFGITGTWQQLTPKPVAIAYNATSFAGTDTTTLVGPIQAALDALFAALGLADGVATSKVVSAIQGVSGVLKFTGVKLTPQGGSDYGFGIGSPSALDVPGATGQIFSRGLVTPTIS